MKQKTVSRFFPIKRTWLPQHRVRERVPVITGIGVVSAVGIGIDKFWDNLLAGKTGIGKISLIDASTFPSQIAAEIKDFNAAEFLDNRQRKYFSRATQFALAAYKMARRDAQIEHLDPYRTDVILGSATSALDEVDKQVFRNPTAGRTFVPGTFDPMILGRLFINAPACAIALTDGIQGHVTTLSSACASALNSVGVVKQRVQDGHCDIGIAGGTDCGINYFSLNSFCACGALSTSNDNPEQALCPFDERHTKSVLGEGAAIFVIEEYRHAIARGAKIYGEVAGFSQRYENINELFFIDKSGSGWSSTLKSSLEEGGGKIDYISAHGPSDEVIDCVESKAIDETFGRRSSKIPVSSIKGAIGSPLGAAGGLQLAAACMAIRTKKIPPNRNFHKPDPECSLNIVGEAKTNQGVRSAMISGHGFGGVNVALVVKEVTL